MISSPQRDPTRSSTSPVSRAIARAAIVYQPLRSLMYDYHRKGLDIMSDNANKGRKVIADLVPSLSQVDRQRVGAMFPLVFFTAKADEFISIFSKADGQQRVAVMNVLNEVDPANGLKYQSQQKN